MTELTIHRAGDSWSGRGDHAGHTITAIEWWPTKMHPLPDGGLHMFSGRVRCTCGVEWDTSIWPPEGPSLIHRKAEPDKALCSVGGDGLALPGDYLASTAAEVTCPDCQEWMHA